MPRLNQLDTTPITLLVQGSNGPLGATTRAGEAAATPLVSGRVTASVQVSSRRDAQGIVALEALPGQDIVALHVEGGPVLYLHPATARDLLQGASGARRDGPVSVGAELPWPGPADPDLGVGAAARGAGDLFRAVLKGVQLISGVGTALSAEIVRRADDQVDPGVYRLPSSGNLTRLKGSGAKLGQVPPADGPQLVLIHGTFVETTSTFGKLWDRHPELVQQLFRGYGEQVYALDHPTLGASPVDNARTLVEALPPGARLHLLTHSRGGLVAEVLARCAGQVTLSEDELALFDDGHEPMREALVHLHRLVQAKHVTVERVVRVACPAHGTLLAARRLDVYVSVLAWLLKAAGLQLLPSMLGFLADVARNRADPALIPGLESIIPGTPLVTWLNAATAPVPGELRVVAGDLQAGGGLLGWAKALLADAYYLTANDIVVHTGSMYGGAARAGGASFLLDQGAATTHFAYFANDGTAAAVTRALLQTQPANFAPIGPLSQSGEDWSGSRGAAAGTNGSAQPERPALFLLPGILGSNLKVRRGNATQRVWLSARLLGNFDRLAYRADADDVESDGPVNLAYDKLASYFEVDHEVVRFGYDWRAPIQGQAKDLATLLRGALEARRGSGQAVRILAHSMGGLLARAVELVDRDLWQELMAQPDGRVLMLGTPNGGSWAPMQVLSGDDTFGNTLAALGSPFASAEARRLMAQMPGLLQLQAGLLDEAQKLSLRDTWQQLADSDYAAELERNWWQRYAGEAVTAAWRWGVPGQEVLDAAVGLRRELDKQAAERLPQWVGKLLLVVGQAHVTPEGFQLSDKGFEYIEALDTGDGRVLLESALLPGVQTWKLDCSHGDLSTRTDAFPAYAELLRQGGTSRLLRLSARRGAEDAADARHAARLPRRVPAAALPGPALDRVFSSGATEAAVRRATTPLRVTMLNGNLVFVVHPLLLGHYASMQLTGTEAAVDRHLGGTMSMALAAGLYPEVLGSHRVFHNTQPRDDNPWALPKPRAAIVAGLGAEGTLTASGLEYTVCQSTKSWSQRATEEAAARGEAPPAELELAATLVGSGGLGVSVGDAARAIARGVLLANRQLAATRWPLVSHLILVEQYLDRAGEAWRGLKVFAQAESASLELDDAIQTGSSPKRRQPESGYRGADYDLIAARTQADGVIEFALDSRRARAEIRARRTQPTLVRQLVAQAATASAGDPSLGNTLFKLLVPMELKPFLAGRDRMVLQLDKGTAPIPWELLDAPSEGEFGRSGDSAAVAAEPWAIRTSLLRKLALREETFRATPRDARAEDAVLVIGEPRIDDPRYPELPGARAEAEAVKEIFDAHTRSSASVTLLLQSNFDEIINTLMRQPWRIVHIAGHGEPLRIDKSGTQSGGVVLSKNVFLGPCEIGALDVVPELVFVNCCHLGGHDASDTLVLPENAVGFAAGVADALIGIGVRCVIAAGWAVDDDAAEVFARTFYAALLEGRRFVDAVTSARRAARACSPGSKTWAAYQCYGDPSWAFREGTDDAQAASQRRQDLQAIPSAAGLALALENLAVDAEVGAVQREAARAQIEDWEKAHAGRWGAMGAIGEAYGVAWAAAGDMDRAVDWFGTAVRSSDGSASLRAAESLVGLRVRLAFERAREGKGSSEEARSEIEAALVQLDALLVLERTVERLSLRGSALKRLAQLEAPPDDPGAAASRLQEALQAYSEAEDVAAEREAPDLFYPAGNRIAIELVLGFGRADAPPPDAAKTARAAQNLAARQLEQPDFWVHATAADVDLMQALAARSLSAAQLSLAARWSDLYARVPSATKWRSVADQARFLLTAYGRVAAGSEADAAQALLKQLLGYAT